MRTKYDLFSKTKFTSLTYVLCVCLLLISFSTAFAADDAEHSVFRNRLYRLRYISAEDAGSFLVDMNIGTQIKIMSDNSMMVSSDDPFDLIKTSSILELIDSRDPYTIEVLTDSPDFETMPSIEKIEAKLAYLSIGTFRNSPSDKTKKLAIIDMHGNQLVAIAPPEYIQSIKETMDLLSDSSKTNTELTTQQELDQTRLEIQKLKKQLAKTLLAPQDDNGMLDDLEKQVDRQTRKVTAKKPKTTLVYQDDKLTRDETAATKKSVSTEVDLKREIKTPKKLDFPSSKKEPLDIPLGEKELELTLTLPEKVEVIALLELVGKQLGLNYIYDAKQIRGDVMLKVHDGKIKVKDTYALLENVLKFRGFVMTRRGNLVTIIPAAQALDYDPTLRKTGDEIQPGDIIVTTVFKLENISTQTAQNLLTGMKLGMTFNPIPETKTLIVTGYAYRMNRIDQLLKMVDIPGKPQSIRYRQLRYTAAVDLAPKVLALAEQLGTIAISVAAPPKAPAKTTSRTRAKTPTRSTTPKAAPPAPGEQGVYLETDERTNRILMIGKKADLDIIDGLIDILDIEKLDLRTIKEYEIQYVDPIEVLETLNEVGVISQTPSSSRSSRSRTTSPRTTSRTARTTASTKTPTTSTLSDDTDPLTDEPQISILEATNSLLVNATAEQHETIAKIISHVDRQLDRASTPYVVYQLENQDPVELEEILTKLIERTQKQTKSKDPKAQTKSTASTSAPGMFEEDIYVIADPATYSIIVYADKKNQQWISDMIKQLDQYRSQVLLDVTLVEISKDDAFQFDLNLVSRKGGFTQGHDMESGHIGGLLGSENWGKTILEASFDSMADIPFTAFYSDRHIQALLQTVDSKGYGRIMAKPSILVKDNEEGIISTKNVIYVAEEKSNVVGGGTNTAAITSTDISFKEYDSGIDLTITPHITSGALLQLAIELKRKDFIPGDTEIVITSVDSDNKTIKKTVPRPLNTVESNVTTVATIPDGATIILGGIEKITQNKSVDKIPILGDIPLIGFLFRGIDESDAQTKLYVFVKAHIIEPADALTGYSDIERISYKKRLAYEKAERRFQGLQSIPGIDPEPMDPLQVLEEDEPTK